MGRALKIGGIVWASLGALSLVSVAGYWGELGSNAAPMIAAALLVFVAPGVILAIRGQRKIDEDDLRWIERVERERALVEAPSRLERPCPWCAEPILEQAKVCKHCGRYVRPRDIETNASRINDE
jgi:hypothetical protein